VGRCGLAGGRGKDSKGERGCRRRIFFREGRRGAGGEVGGVVALAFPGKTGVTDAEGGMAGGELGAALAAFGGVVLTARM